MTLGRVMSLMNRKSMQWEVRKRRLGIDWPSNRHAMVLGFMEVKIPTLESV